jgi:hypothetical protein
MFRPMMAIITHGTDTIQTTYREKVKSKAIPVPGHGGP